MEQQKIIFIKGDANGSTRHAHVNVRGYARAHTNVSAEGYHPVSLLS